jgi:dihydrofolate synthase / folylpolyglutamate synthase
LKAVYLSYEAVCEELDRRRRIALGFERIKALLTLLGNPQRYLRIVQIVGTNGKGTTAVALAAALNGAGRACGTYLSPHVLSYTERVMLRGRFVPEEDFAAAMGRAIEVADTNGIPATQFELLTAGALALFRDTKLEWAILEAGLGARHDATSVAEPEAIILTNVGLDHTEYLGATVEKIAEEKLASLRPDATLLLGTNDPRVVGLARETAKKAGANLVEHREQDMPHQAVSIVGSGAYPYSLGERGQPPYLARNERLGMRAAEVLLGRPLRQDERQTARGLARAARLPARFEVHEVRGVPVIVDGGHNPEGLEAALGAVRAKYAGRPLGVVFGALKDKDVGTMLAALEREAHTLVLTRPGYATDGRALDPRWVEKEYDPRDAEGRRAWVASDAGEALCLAVEEMKQTGGVVLIAGSLYTGAGILGWMRRGR